MQGGAEDRMCRALWFRPIRVRCVNFAGRLSCCSVGHFGHFAGKPAYLICSIQLEQRRSGRENNISVQDIFAKMLFRSIVDRGVFSGRCNGQQRYPLHQLLDCYQCARPDEHISYGDMGVPVPPFGCTFSTAPEIQHMLAVANEEGIIRLYNTESRKNPIFKEWLAHSNVVFDIAWVPGEPQIVTASGDKTAVLWDVKTIEHLGTFKGHQCSLKSVAFGKQEKAVFCTGGRDGNIMVWDTRCSKKDGFYRHVKLITGAHNKLDRQTPSKLKKQLAGRRVAPSVDSQQSVTVVLFRDENTLISAGAVDGVVKMWDLRKNYTVHHQDPIPLQAYPYPGTSSRKLGYCSLALDSTGSRLFANCTDENIYMFDVTGLKKAPVGVFNGHLNSSFYIKSSVSPDDQFLASGSSDHNAYIWKISDPKAPPMMLQGHCQEVTSVAWCPTDFTKIASCSDDNTVRIWRLSRGTDGEDSASGAADLVGWACLKKKPSEVKSPEPVTPLERTPAKNPRIEASAALSSPQAADCAPSTTDMPLPSSTHPSFQTLGHKSLTPASRTPTTPRQTSAAASSIKKWLTKTSNSSSLLTPRSSSPRTPCSAALRTSSPRKVLSPVGQSPPPPASKRRVKRCLEPSGGDTRRCLGDCDCVMELDPLAKKRQGLGGVYCLTEEEKKEQHQQGPRPGHTEQEAQQHLEAGQQIPSLGHLGKENGSPGRADWLSAMGQRLKRERGSPTSLRSPGAKKQVSRTTGSPTPTTPGSMKKISLYFQKKTPE
ncbi:denticleless protein homolog isoform X2 [Acipenser ruthenus]|uniref:denticleless protein homolog isoform X2 n=1 Tax=Acipenser ruthenus TaxID=7906 RepID=UPI002740D872|nr:denticleless protein homolog isoform X2 [Acipenser ruthenus]